MLDVKLTITGKNLSREAILQLKRDLDQTASSLGKVDKKNKDVKDSSKDTREGMLGLAAGLGAVSAATMLLVRSAVNAAVQFERMKLGLAAVAGSAKAANIQMKEFKELAKLPGLGLPEVVKAATSLQALDISLSTTTEVIREWGNELVRMGKGRYELDRIVLALTQMVGKGTGFGQEIRQIAEAMPSIRKHMKEAFGTTASEEFKKMGITAQRFIAGITAELAKMPRVAGGAANATENFTDAMFNARVALGEALLPAFTKTMDAFVKLLEGFTQLSEGLRSLISWSALAVGGITGLSAAILGLTFTVTKLTPAILLLRGALETMYIWLLYNPWAVYAAGIAMAVIAIVSFYGHLQKAKYDVESLTKSVEKLTASTAKTQEMRKLADRLEELRKKTNLTVEESKELEDIQERLIAISPRVIEKFDKEGKAAEVSADKVRTYADEIDSLNKESGKVKIREAEDQIKHYTTQIEKAKAEQKLWADRLEDTNKRIEESGRIVYISTGRLSYRIDLQKVAIDQEKERQEAVNNTIKAEQDLIKARTNLAILMKQEILGPPTPAAVPPPYEPSEKEKEAALEAAMELKEAKIQAYEDEYDKKVALAKLAFEQETQGIEEQKKAIEESEAADDEKYTKLSVLDAKYKAAVIRRDTAIKQANKDRADEELKLDKERLDRMKAQNEQDKEFRLEANKRAVEIAKRQADEEIRLDQQRLNQMKAQNEKSGDLKIAANKRLMEITKRQSDKEAKENKERLDRMRSQNEQNRQFRIDANKRLMEAIKADEEAIRKEAIKTFDAYYTAEQLRISLIDDMAQREIAQAKLVYEAKIYLIKTELEEATISADRRAELERQLFYLSEKYAKDTAKIQNETRDRMIKGFSNALAAMPFDLARVFYESTQIEKGYVDDIRDLNLELRDEINRIRDDVALNAAQKAREIERIEKDSANRRLEIERDLVREREDLFENYIKSFLFGLLREVEAEIQKQIAGKIVSKLATLALNFLAPGAGGGNIPLPGGGLPIAIPIPGFDNPVHDAMARQYGRHTAMMLGSSFDDPYNDFRAKLKGTDAAAYSLGRRSADDMLSNFQQGFIQGSQTANIEGGTGNRELIGALSAIQSRLDNPPEFKLILDGRELHSKIFSRNDKLRARGDGY